ncbi:MAG TPA: flagellar hook-basal body complex protein FliE [Solirubrobacteraceae bacterium]|jgi:flagellar hook-basal body complex protein FliE|nr:flagellar hook-basal body complex protein FliE [Solirubrobacteraceae bacterium]
MIVPAVSGLASKLSEGLSNSASPQTVGGLTQGGQSAQATSSGLGLEGSSGLEGTRGVEGIGGVEGTGGVGGASSGGSGSFGSELSEAISSLESTQLSSDSAAQSLATGTAKDPESAVVTVEDAQMAMDLASQLRTKATEAAQNLFQTQV